MLSLCGMGARWMNEYAALVEWYRWWKTEVLGDKPDPVLLWPSQTPHRLTWNWAQGSTVKGQRLVVWVVAWLKQRCQYNLIQFRYPTYWNSSECNSSNYLLALTYINIFDSVLSPLIIWGHPHHSGSFIVYRSMYLQ